MFLGVVKQKARKKINGYIGIADTKTKRPDKKKKKTDYITNQPNSLHPFISNRISC